VKFAHKVDCMLLQYSPSSCWLNPQTDDIALKDLPITIYLIYTLHFQRINVKAVVH
jgi:hypothetical protein